MSGTGVKGSSGARVGVQGCSGGDSPSPYLVEKTGVYGYAAQDNMARGVLGETTSGYGVVGQATTGVGLYGYSSSGNAVIAVGGSPEMAAVAAAAGGGGTGVVGYSGSFPVTATFGPPATGVYGFADEVVTARGVHGRTTIGQGVRGEATTGTGGYFTCATGGTALQVVGRARFDRASRVKILKGRSSYRKYLAGVSTSSQVFAVLSAYRSGTYVAAVVCASGYFTIYLNKALAYDTWVSYFVVN